MKLKDKLYKWLDDLATTRLDEVSSLQRIARDGYKYIEGSHEMMIHVEMQSGSPDYIIYSNTISRWLPPHEQEVISGEKQQQILDNLCKFLDRRKTSYKVE